MYKSIYTSHQANSFVEQNRQVDSIHLNHTTWNLDHSAQAPQTQIQELLSTIKFDSQSSEETQVHKNNMGVKNPIMHAMPFYYLSMSCENTSKPMFWTRDMCLEEARSVSSQLQCTSLEIPMSMVKSCEFNKYMATLFHKLSSQRLPKLLQLMPHERLLGPTSGSHPSFQTYLDHMIYFYQSNDPAYTYRNGQYSYRCKMKNPKAIITHVNYLTLGVQISCHNLEYLGILFVKGYYYLLSSCPARITLPLTDIRVKQASIFAQILLALKIITETEYYNTLSAGHDALFTNNIHPLILNSITPLLIKFQSSYYQYHQLLPNYNQLLPMYNHLLALKQQLEGPQTSTHFVGI